MLISHKNRDKAECEFTVYCQGLLPSRITASIVLRTLCISPACRHIHLSQYKTRRSTVQRIYIFSFKHLINQYTETQMV